MRKSKEGTSESQEGERVAGDGYGHGALCTYIKLTDMKNIQKKEKSIRYQCNGAGHCLILMLIQQTLYPLSHFLSPYVGFPKCVF